MTTSSLLFFSLRPKNQTSSFLPAALQQAPYKTLFSLLLGVSLSISSSLVMAISLDYAALLDPIIKKQPESLLSKGLKAQLIANQSLSDNWLSDSASFTASHENDALTGNLDTQNWAMGVEFTLLKSPQKNALKNVSTAYRGQLAVQNRYLNWLASGKLRQLVWRYTKANIALDFAESALKKSLELEKNVKLKVEVGNSTQLDMLMAKKFVLEQQALVSNKQGLLTLAKNQFQLWTNTPQLPSDITETHHKIWSTQNHPKLRWVQSAYEVSNAEYAQQKTYDKAGPSFFIGAQKDQNKLEDNTFLIFELSVPIGNAPKNKMNLAEKLQTKQMKKIALIRAQQTLEAAVLAAEQMIIMKKSQQLLLQQQNQIAQKTLQLAQQSYQLGESPIQSLLLIQKSALEAKLNLELASASLGEAIANANQVKGHNLNLVLERGNQ